MAHTVVDHDSLHGIFSMVCRGTISVHDLFVLIYEHIALKKGVRLNMLLLDASGAELSATYADLFDLPHRLCKTLGMGRPGRIALILPVSEERVQSERFFETACRNQSWIIRIFKEHESAVKWLVSRRYNRKGER